MFSLRRLLYDIENVEQEKNAVVQPAISITDLHNTSKSLEKLSSPDREIDVVAKLAVLMDMGLEKEASKVENIARKLLWKKQDLNRAAKITREADRVAKETTKIEKGTTLGDYKGRILAGTGMLGTLYLGTKLPGNDKKDELRDIARKYYSLGRQSTGGA
jgi:hypothetical protein